MEPLKGTEDEKSSTLNNSGSNSNSNSESNSGDEHNSGNGAGEESDAFVFKQARKLQSHPDLKHVYQIINPRKYALCFSSSHTWKIIKIKN